MTDALSRRERYFLSLLAPDGATIMVGLSVGESLYIKGLVTLAKWKRYGITEAGRAALAGVAYAANGAGRPNAPPRKTPIGTRPKGRGTGAGTGQGDRGLTGQGQGQLPLI
jgi:hypothetical protein